MIFVQLDFMILFFVWLTIFLLLFYIIFKTAYIFNHKEFESKLNGCFDFNMSHVNSYIIYDTLTINTIAYDERIPGYRMFGTGKVDNYIYLECLVFKSYKNSKCVSYIQPISNKIINGFVIYVIVKNVEYVPKYVMINEHCFTLPNPASPKKRLYEYTLCAIPDFVEKDENYERLWVSYHRRIGIERIVFYKHQNLIIPNIYGNLLDIITINTNFPVDVIMNDCFYRYRLKSKSVIFMKERDIILFLEANNTMKLNNFITERDRESNDIIYLSKCKSIDRSNSISFRLSKHKLKCENKNACSFIIINNLFKFNYITQKGYFGDYWFYSKTKKLNNVVVLEMI